MKLEQRICNMKDEDLNFRGQYPDNTPLHLAIKNGEFEVVQLLLQRNANLFLEDENGKLPLENAIECENCKERDKIAAALVERMPKQRSEIFIERSSLV